MNTEGTPISTNDSRNPSPFRYQRSEQSEQTNNNRLSGHRTPKRQEIGTKEEDTPITKPFSRLSISSSKNSLRESTHIINRQYTQTVENNSTMQSNLQSTMKKSRWICCGPLILLPKLISIYQQLLVTSNTKISTAQLKQAQNDYEEAVSKIFRELVISKDTSMNGRQEEFEVQCARQFKSFIHKKIKRDLGLSAIQKQKKELENECKILERQEPTANMVHLHQLKLKDIQGQLALLTKKEAMHLQFAKVWYNPTEENPLFVKYKKYYEGIYFGDSVNVQNEIPLEIIERAERICKECFQFSPTITCLASEFTNKIDIEFLESCDHSDLSVSVMNIETPMASVSKSLLEKNIKKLQSELKNWNELSKTLQMIAKELKTATEGCQKQLTTIDNYSEYRQQRKKAEDFVDIWHACKEGPLSAIKKQYEKSKGPHFNINAPRELFGFTLLHYAIERKVPEIVEYFLKNQASAFVFNNTAIQDIPFLYTPFHLATAMCDKKIFDMCLLNYESSFLTMFVYPSIGAEKINMTTTSKGDQEKYTALHFVIQPKLLFPYPTEEHMKNWHANAPGMIKTLLAKGAATSVPSCQSAFVFAVDLVVSLLKEQGQNEKKKMRSAVDDTQAALKTLLSCIDPFLERSLSGKELEMACANVVTSLLPQSMDDENIVLLKKILCCSYFSTQDGKKFVTYLYNNTKNSFFKDCMRKYLLPDLNLSALSSPRAHFSTTRKEGDSSPRTRSGSNSSPRLGVEAATEKKISPRQRERVQSTPSSYFNNIVIEDCSNTTLPQIMISKTVVPRSMNKRAPLRSLTESSADEKK